MTHNVSQKILDEGLALRDQVLWEDINDQLGAFFTGAVYVAEQHAADLQKRIDQLENPVEADVLVGNFIATYDEAAAGCLLDANIAEALAKEFKKMKERINQLEATLEDILLDEGAIFAMDPTCWASYRAAKALTNNTELTQHDFQLFQQQIVAKRSIEGGKSWEQDH